MISCAHKCELPRSGIAYQVHDEKFCSPRLLVSETEFDRAMSQVVNGAAYARTIAFPNTVRGARGCAFAENKELISAVLNEGLEVLGEHEKEYGQLLCGVFESTALQRVALPSTLRMLGDHTFRECS